MFVQDEKGRVQKLDKKTELKQKKKKKKKHDPKPDDNTPPPPDNVTIQSGEIDNEPADTPPIPQMTWHFHPMKSQFPQIRGPFPKMMS